jgi:hypothetical protein
MPIPARISPEIKGLRMTYLLKIKENNRDDTPWRFVQTFPDPQQRSHCIEAPLLRRAHSIVIRTNTWANFCKDFFLPNFFEALKTHALATKIIEGLLGVITDIITFPTRCIAFYRHYHEYRNNQKENHPLHQYLTKQKADSKILDTDQIYMQTIDISKRPDGKFDIQSRSHFVPFIEIPAHELNASSLSDSIQGISPRQLEKITTIRFQ